MAALKHEQNAIEDAARRRKNARRPFVTTPGVQTRPETQSHSAGTKKEEDGWRYLSREERESMRKEGRCFTCRQKGHMSKDCTQKKEKIKKEENRQVGTSSSVDTKSLDDMNNEELRTYIKRLKGKEKASNEADF